MRENSLEDIISESNLLDIKYHKCDEGKSFFVDFIFDKPQIIELKVVDGKVVKKVETKKIISFVYMKELE